MPDIQQQPDSIETASLHEADLRKHRRHLCVDSGVIRLSVRPEFRGRRALLVDISAGGIGFLLEEPLDAGMMLVFELKTGTGAEPMNRIARVRHSRLHSVPLEAPWLPQSSGLGKIFRGLFGLKAPPPAQAWLVGCEFDRSLSDTEIGQFLDQLAGESAEFEE